MLYIMGFLTEEPPPLGRRPYDPNDLHITYLGWAELTPPQINRLLKKLSKIAEQQEPLPFKLEDSFQMFGENNDIPVRKVESRYSLPHCRLNFNIEQAVRETGGELVSRFAYSPHIANATEIIEAEIEHLSVIHHEGSLGVNTKNIANFSLKRS